MPEQRQRREEPEQNVSGFGLLRDQDTDIGIVEVRLEDRHQLSRYFPLHPVRHWPVLWRKAARQHFAELSYSCVF